MLSILDHPFYYISNYQQYCQFVSKRYFKETSYEIVNGPKCDFRQYMDTKGWGQTMKIPSCTNVFMYLWNLFLTKHAVLLYAWNGEASTQDFSKGEGKGIHITRC